MGQAARHLLPIGDGTLKPVLVLGIGNILLRDEGIGVRVVEALSGVALGDEVEVLDGGTSGADLVDVLADRRRVIVIDAADIDGPPGTVARLDGDDLLARAGQAMSLHEIGLAESLLMARQLGCPPREVIVFGVRTADTGVGLELSPLMADLVPRLVQLVIRELAAADDPAGAPHR